MQSVLLGYCALTYILGIFIMLLYATGIVLLKRKYENVIWWWMLFLTLISPVFVPWWIVQFVKRNKGG